MTRRAAVISALIVLCKLALAAEIVVVYPRLPGADQPFVYADGLDSSFIFGHITPPAGQLTINSVEVPYTAQGAFLAYLPLRRDSATKSWDVTLTDKGRLLERQTVPYAFQSDIPSLPDTGLGIRFPRVVRVSDANAHTRATPGGSYHLFPVRGTPLLATGYHEGFIEFELAPSFSGYIEPRFVTAESDSTLPRARIGNGACQENGDSCRCAFSMTRAVPWTAELAADGKQLDVFLFQTALAVDRFQFAGRDDFLQEAMWSPDAKGVQLSLRFREPLTRGYDITFLADSLRINAREPFAKRERKLKGKTVLVDAGHGGEAKGAIGPLGTLEKDITLRWATILAKELKRKGARVVMTRTGDVDVPLYERIAIGRAQHADFWVSLHANALPDGMNPFLKHGTGTYYYQSLSRPAAEILHKQMLKASGLLNDGLYDANFAVVRPTSFPAVLLEAAYVMNPPEEELLRSDKYLRKLAKGVVRGLTEYFRTQP